MKLTASTHTFSKVLNQIFYTFYQYLYTSETTEVFFDSSNNIQVMVLIKKQKSLRQKNLQLSPLNSFIIMNILLEQQKQPLSNQLKLFNQIYRRKFTNESLTELAQKRRIVASQSKPKKADFFSTLQQQISSKTLKKSKTIGSLLPKLKQIQSIANAEKKPSKKSQTNSLSKLQIYLGQKNIKKQQQFNIMFITQNNSVVPDRVINQKFCELIAIAQTQKPKNLRALLNLTGGFELTEQGKKLKIHSQKKQLTQIVKTMIEEHYLEQQKQAKEQQSQNQEDQEENNDKSESQLKNQQDRGIGWVLKQCKRYNKKFKVGKSKSKNKKKISPS